MLDIFSLNHVNSNTAWVILFRPEKISIKEYHVIAKPCDLELDVWPKCHFHCLSKMVPYPSMMLSSSKGETITCVNGNVLFFAGKRLQNF